MKITALETLRTDEFSNILWVRVHTDAGLIGLGETFYGAGAVEAHIHDTLSERLLGRDPLRIEFLNKEMLNLPLAQSSTGAEYRAASAIDIALWDLFGKFCGQPVHQLLGGLCAEKVRVYNTCAGYRYVRTRNIRPVETWNISDQEGPYEDLSAFMNQADVLAKSLLEQGIMAMKIWPFDPAAQETGGLYITAEQMKMAIAPFEKIRAAVGDRMEIMVEFHVWVCASETLGSRWPFKELLERNATHVAMVDLCWAGGLTEGRKIAALAETWHRPFAPHDCTGRVGFVAAVHASFSQPNTLIQESVRAFYTSWYRELVTAIPRIENGFVYPMEGIGLCVELQPAVFERADLHVRRSHL